MDPETLDLKPNSCKLPCGHWGIELTTLGRAGSILNPYAISSVPYLDGKSLGLVASIVRPARCPRLCLCYLGSAQLSSAQPSGTEATPASEPLTVSGTLQAFWPGSLWHLSHSQYCFDTLQARHRLSRCDVPPTIAIQQSSAPTTLQPQLHSF